MSTDLNTMLKSATDIFNGIWPIFAVVVFMGLGSGVFQFIRTFVEELHALQQGQPTPIQKPKNQPPADPDYISEPPTKPKNDLSGLAHVVGIGDDGELVYEGDQIVEDEEPRYMRRIW